MTNHGWSADDGSQFVSPSAEGSPAGAEGDTFIGMPPEPRSNEGYWRANAARASAARSTKDSPLASMTTRLMVPPMNGQGDSPT